MSPPREQARPAPVSTALPGSAYPPGYAQRPSYGPPPGSGQAAPYGPPPTYGRAPTYGQPAAHIRAPASPRPSSRRRRTPRSDPGGLVAGLVIAGLGLFFLAGQLEPDIGRFVTLFIGLALLAVFVVRREYGFLVPGSILTGVGIGIALEPATSGVTESGVMMLALAGGFLGIWVIGSLYRLPQNHWWPLIPGGILTLIGLVQLSRSDVDGALRLWPVILIILGALVLARTLTRRT
jgi:hypothetical protein